MIPHPPPSQMTTIPPPFEKTKKVKPLGDMKREEKLKRRKMGITKLTARQIFSCFFPVYKPFRASS